MARLWAEFLKINVFLRWALGCFLGCVVLVLSIYFKLILIDYQSDTHFILVALLFVVLLEVMLGNLLFYGRNKIKNQFELVVFALIIGLLMVFIFLLMLIILVLRDMSGIDS